MYWTDNTSHWVAKRISHYLEGLPLIQSMLFCRSDPIFANTGVYYYSKSSLGVLEAPIVIDYKLPAQQIPECKIEQIEDPLSGDMKVEYIEGSLF